MVYKKEFEKTFRLTRYLLKISGLSIINLNTTTQFIIHLLYYFNMMFLYTDVAGQIFWYFKGVELGMSVMELSALAPCTAFSLLSTVKFSFLYFNKKTVISAMNKLREIHPEDDEYSDDVIVDREKNKVKTKLDGLEKKLVKDSILLIKTTLRIQGILWIVLILCFSISPLVIMINNYYTTGKYEYLVPVLSKYFFEINTELRWFLVYVHQIWSMLIVCANFFGEHEEVDYTSPETYEMGISSIILCLCMFNITFSENISNLITFGTFLILILVKILLVNYFGDMLMTSSTRMGDAVYDCLWYAADTTVMKDILFILLRTQIPCKISAGGFADLKLTTFTSILSTSWSYFALLRTMYD